MEDERAAWNRRYQQGSHAKREPDPFLLAAYDEFIAPEFPNGGRALDIAGGLGRNAFWLAERGWQVTLVDISEVGIAQAQAEAIRRKVRMEFVVADLQHYRPERHRYHLVVVFFYLERRLFPALQAALRPGGILVYRTYTELAHKLGRGPGHPMYFLKTNELLHAFPNLQVVHYRESIRERGIAELVARKLR